ncbi:MAG: alpha/beta hydrolase [Halomonadaceae bacterium]|nr:MAG: alpha/beta hydrolase [Halomonadaceae bacterium]
MSDQHHKIAPWQRQVSAITSGFLGDWLEQRGNPLAVELQLLHRGRALNLARPQLEDPETTLVVMIHGLTEMETIWDFPGQPGVHYASELSPLMPATPLCLRYNTGRPIYRNGEELAHTLNSLVQQWPVPVKRLVLIGHSMGGLLIRSACHYGSALQLQWPELLTDCLYLGSPHDGSWLARAAHHSAGLLQKMPRDYLRVVGDFLDLRSEGIRNLNQGDILAEAKAMPPLLTSSRHYAIAGLLLKQPENPINLLFGDALVQENSARGLNQPGWQLTDTASFGGIDHIRLTHHPRVYQQLKEWLL